MKIDYNEIEMAAMTAYKRGEEKESVRLGIEFSKQLRESIARGEDHCSCTRPCRMHGKCVECVAAHRAHRDHLPVCFHDMVNEKICGLSALTEGTVVEKIAENNAKEKSAE